MNQYMTTYELPVQIEKSYHKGFYLSLAEHQADFKPFMQANGLTHMTIRLNPYGDEIAFIVSGETKIMPAARDRLTAAFNNFMLAKFDDETRTYTMSPMDKILVELVETSRLIEYAERFDKPGFKFQGIDAKFNYELDCFDMELATFGFQLIHPVQPTDGNVFPDQDTECTSANGRKVLRNAPLDIELADFKPENQYYYADYYIYQSQTERDNLIDGIDWMEQTLKSDDHQLAFFPVAGNCGTVVIASPTPLSTDKLKQIHQAISHEGHIKNGKHHAFDWDEFNQHAFENVKLAKLPDYFKDVSMQQSTKLHHMQVQITL